MEQDKVQVLDAAVRLCNVGYAYAGSGHRHAALHDVSLEVPHGARLLLVGGNGSGKSTLLKVVAGMCMAKGTSRVLGRDAFCDTSLNEHVQFIGEPWPTSANWTSTVRQTVERYPNVDWRRFEELCHALHVDPEWRVDHCSSGMKRRIQVLLGLLYPKQVLCLDECTSDLDVVERENVLRFMRAASTAANPVTILYATHIFDHLEGWPTHIAHLHEGRLQQLHPINELTKSLMQTAYEWISKGTADAAHFPAAPALPETAPIIQLKDLSCRVGRDGLGKFSTAKTVLQDLTLTVPRGARALLVGTNGSGKTSLLQVLAGKKYIPPGHATISGLPVFHEPKLNAVLAFSGDWWDSLPQWDLTVADLLGETGMGDARVVELLTFLGVDVGWHVRKVSSGQRKRIQLLLNLREFRELLLLDEVTAELDIVQRVAFMQFLHRESTLRGATVLYSTHILEGLDGWASHIIGVDQLTRQCFHIPIPADAPGKTSHLLEAVDTALRALKDQEWEAISRRI